VIDALGTPQSILLLGGTSDIALAIAERYLAMRPMRIVLAARPSERLDEAAGRLTERGARTEIVKFDATDTDSHADALDKVFEAGDIDIAVVAFGLLGDQLADEDDPGAAVAVAKVNYVGAVSSGLILARAMRRQGHGVIVALSSVAGERPRRANFIYGSSKAGMDAFYTGLAEALSGSGVHVLVVRPGHVRSKMTTHLPAAPLATTPSAVAAAIVTAIRNGRRELWVPGQMRLVMGVLRRLPRPIFRRLRF
jgi:decaprenylphospho-beta-D-erythro-pentofuranosid-2-ulose 2-reductase